LDFVAHGQYHAGWVLSRHNQIWFKLRLFDSGHWHVRRLYDYFDSEPAGVSKVGMLHGDVLEK
jgi:hypothetical protein